MFCEIIEINIKKKKTERNRDKRKIQMEIKTVFLYGFRHDSGFREEKERKRTEFVADSDGGTRK